MKTDAIRETCGTETYIESVRTVFSALTINKELF